jgi:hypothetical protein
MIVAGGAACAPTAINVIKTANPLLKRVCITTSLLNFVPFSVYATFPGPLKNDSFP